MGSDQYNIAWRCTIRWKQHYAVKNMLYYILLIFAIVLNDLGLWGWIFYSNAVQEMMNAQCLNFFVYLFWFSCAEGRTDRRRDWNASVQIETHWWSLSFWWKKDKDSKISGKEGSYNYRAREIKVNIIASVIFLISS